MPPEGDAVSTGIELKEREALQRAVEEVIASPVLRTSTSLCKLLRYLAQQSIDQPETPHKEYQIATEVFGRAADFDPRLDSVVRVQSGRLRSKLAEYYAGPGSKDDLIIILPKGSYALSMQHRNPPATTSAEAAETTPKEATDTSADNRAPTASPRLGGKGLIALAFLVGVLLASTTLIFINHHKEIALQRNIPPIPAALQVFWSPFVRAPEDPLVVFTNSVFVGTADQGMRYFDPSRDSRDLIIEQHYTGVGEVVGVLELDRVFHRFERQFRIKRAGLFTLDEARHNNLIFMGSPTENVRLGEIPNMREFVIRRLPGGPNGCDYAVVDLHPQPGKPDTFFSTPRTRPMEVDYAVIALMRGLDRNHWTLILAGTSTIGTQAAIESVSDKDFLEELLGDLKTATGADIKPFEALLRVKVANDVPLQTQLIAARHTG
jgi:hypothetical protein